MNENWKTHERVLPSADLVESADSARQNGDSSLLDHLNSKAKERIGKCKRHEKIETQNRKNVDAELEAELHNIGVRISKVKLQKNAANEIYESQSISTANQIKAYKEELVQHGRTASQILKALIAKFEKSPEAKVIVENCKNFLALHEFAATKPPAEQKAIENIISKADFTNENAFTATLSQISKSSDISTQTKVEIAQKFNAGNISTVGQIDSTLKQIQTRKKDMEKAIDTKTAEKESLQTEIENLEEELETLTLLDPKRKEVEAKLKEKKEVLKDTETTLQTLNDQKPDEVSFELREGFTAQLNPNGTRTIKIDDLNFSILLPENRLFMSKMNFLSINLTFVYRAFTLNGMESIFTPKLENETVPDKKNRLFGSRILKQLGYPTNLILLQSNISQLQKDLSKLKQKGVVSTGMEDLEKLGIWDTIKQEINTNRLNSCLQFIRQNRNRTVEFEDLKEL